MLKGREIRNIPKVEVAPNLTKELKEIRSI